MQTNNKLHKCYYYVTHFNYLKKCYIRYVGHKYFRILPDLKLILFSYSAYYMRSIIFSSNRTSSTPPSYHQLHITTNNFNSHSIQQPLSITNVRRVLRPRTEPRSYVESPDALINGLLEKPRTNGNLEYSSDSSEGEMPPLAPVKEYSPGELKQRWVSIIY